MEGYERVKLNDQQEADLNEMYEHRMGKLRGKQIKEGMTPMAPRDSKRIDSDREMIAEILRSQGIDPKAYSTMMKLEEDGRISLWIGPLEPPEMSPQ